MMEEVSKDFLPMEMAASTAVQENIHSHSCHPPLAKSSSSLSPNTNTFTSYGGYQNHHYQHGSNLNNILNNFTINNANLQNGSTNKYNATHNCNLMSRHPRNYRTEGRNTSNSSIDVLLSKSAGHPSLFMTRSNRTKLESSESPSEKIVIRHAGYLLKRSNLPYNLASCNNMSTTNINDVENERLIENIIDKLSPLPDLNEAVENCPSTEPSSGAREGEENYFTGGNGVPPCASVKSEDTPCLCFPLLQIFENFFRVHRVPPPVHFVTGSDAILNSDLTDTALHRTRDDSLTQTINYEMPLKAPARSVPVPISPHVLKTNIRPQQRPKLSFPHRLRSYSNENKMNNDITWSSAGTLSSYDAYREEKTVQHPPPPADYIDPKDSHIWRAKYCVLEDGVLYFYRNAEEGESDDAKAERDESKVLQSFDGQSSGNNDASYTTNSPKRASSCLEGKGLAREKRRISSCLDIHDLSKSPMPLRKSDIFDLVRKGSSTSVGDNPDKSLDRSSSTSTFYHDADILWEKRVAIDCVGAVRSSEQEYGPHAFELLAFGMDGRVTGDELSDDSASTLQHEIVDRLILRARNSDDMNDWMFQFHRSLTYYMQRIVDSVKNGDPVAFTSDFSSSQRNYQRTDYSIYNRRRPTPIHGNVGLPLTPILTRQSSSPTVHSFGGSISSNIAVSLSHGHGRNAVYRRHIRDNKDGFLSMSPSYTPGGGSSPLDEKIVNIAPVTLQSTLITADETIVSFVSPQDDILQSESAPKKYVPPHKRRNVNDNNVPIIVTSAKESDSIQKAYAKETQLNITTFEELTDGEKDFSDLRDESLSESASSSLLSRLIDNNVDVPLLNNVRLGGCADPKVVVGSILDNHYISRKASVVGNARLEAYGAYGGGFFTTPEQHFTTEGITNVVRRSSLKWEVGAASECGVRNSNEDSYVAINNLDEFIRSQGLVSFADQDFGRIEQQGLYAIFDGHVGNQAARFSAERFPDLLIEEQSFLASTDSACLRSIEKRTDIILRKAFDRLDRDFCNLCTRDGRDWDSGSTALVALIVDDVVTVANLGDCRGVICRMISSENVDLSGWEKLDADEHEGDKWDRANGGVSNLSRGKLFWKEVTETHSPLLSKERTRIESANGWIIKETEIPTGQLHRMDFFDKDVIEIVKRCFADRLKQHRSDPVRQIQIARTCGDLAVSRAIGDRDFKAEYNLPPDVLKTVQVATEEKTTLSCSWDGPPVFIYPDGHSGRFKGDLISNIPDIQYFKVGQEGVEDEFFLMACDGLWDVMDGDDAVRVAKDLLFEKKLTAKDGAARLAELAKHLGSSDNITVILIRFYWESE